jgi:hypothetical protein
MTAKLPFTQAQLRYAIAAARGFLVPGLRPLDGAAPNLQAICGIILSNCVNWRSYRRQPGIIAQTPQAWRG